MQAQELRQQVDEDLRQLALTYDDETQKLAEELTASSQQKYLLPQLLSLRPVAHQNFFCSSFNFLHFFKCFSCRRSFDGLQEAGSGAAAAGR